MGKLAFWHSLADIERFPHILLFDSLPELLSLSLQQAGGGGAATSGLMRRHFQRVVVANVLRFYRGVVERLLPGAEKSSTSHSGVGGCGVVSNPCISGSMSQIELCELRGVEESRGE